MKPAVNAHLPISSQKPNSKLNECNAHLRRLSNDALVLGIRNLVASERKITREILEYINEIERRRLCPELGFSSSFEWLTKSLGYSAPAAHRRIQAARLLRSDDEIAGKIETGAVNLTTLALVQTTIKAEEKRSGEKMTAQQKSEVVSKVESKSSREAEFVLAGLFPQSVARKESVTVVDDNHLRAHVTLTKSQMQKLERIGELLSHRLSKGGVKASLGEIIEAAADELLKRKDPLLKVATKPAVKPKSAVPQSKTGSGVLAQPKFQPVSVALKKHIFTRDEGKCQYLDPCTGHKCESRFHLQVDHKYPRALGGGNSVENLRVMCRAHNLLLAEQCLGGAVFTRS